MIFAGDIGATKTILALFERRDDQFASLHEKTYQSKDYDGLAAVAGAFLDHADCAPEAVEAACFGLAGAVIDQKCATPNLPWTVDAAAVRQTLGLKSVTLINDLEATGWGIPWVPAGQLVALNDVPPHPHRHGALIAAGTGLGQALLVREGTGFRPLPSEGGHCDFAPRNDLEIDLLRFMQPRFGHVSYERIVSGPGLMEIYTFLKRRDELGDEPEWLSDRLATGDPSATVAQTALSHKSPLCEKALDLFVSLYGAETGNLALKMLALGGVYVGGGIAPKIRAKIEDGAFLQAFFDKGRFAPLMRQMPVFLIAEKRTALWGAARYAVR